jgi:hypothetical protein
MYWGRAEYFSVCPLSQQQPSAPANVASLSCTSPVTRGGTVTCTVTAPSGTAVSGWKFTDARSNTVTRTTSTTSLTWSGAMATGGTVSVTAGATLTASVTVTARNWKTGAASPASEPNGTFITLPVPPQPNGGDSGLGYFAEELGDTGFNVTVIQDNGPNDGYGYYSSQLTYSPDYFQYEINPDLQNTGSTFYSEQCGNYNATTNPSGYISGSNLLTQTNRHEWNSATESHYAFYATSLSTNNPGSYFESSVAAPGTNMTTFVNDSRSTLNGLYTQIGSDAGVEPYPVNYSETDSFLGNINYAPYTSCQ